MPKTDKGRTPMKYRVRNSRTLTTPDGRVWARGGQLVEIDVSQAPAQRLMSGRMGLLTPADGEKGEPVALPRHWQDELNKQGYKAPVTKEAEPSAPKKRGPGRPRKVNKELADPEE